MALMAAAAELLTVWAPEFVAIWPLTTLLLLLVIVVCRILGTHMILRWPIFLLLSARIAINLVFYVGIRLAIRVSHWYFRPHAVRRRDVALDHARTYDQWLMLAEQADAEEGRESWRAAPESNDYDWRHVEATVQRLRESRRSGDMTALQSLLLHSLKHNTFGELEIALYSRARAGTKRLLVEYREEVCEGLRSLAALGTGSAELREFCVSARASLGGVALVLSGGALFGVFHFGLVRALLELRMLPQVLPAPWLFGP